MEWRQFNDLFKSESCRFHNGSHIVRRHPYLGLWPSWLAQDDSEFTRQRTPVDNCKPPLRIKRRGYGACHLSFLRYTVKSVGDQHIVHLPWQQFWQIACIGADQIQHCGSSALKFGLSLLKHGGVYVDPVYVTSDGPREGCREITIATT